MIHVCNDCNHPRNQLPSCGCYCHWSHVERGDEVITERECIVCGAKFEASTGTPALRCQWCVTLRRPGPADVKLRNAGKPAWMVTND